MAAWFVLLFALTSCTPEGGSKELDAVVPIDVAMLPEALRSLIDEHVRAVREAPDNAERHATLALVYSANILWGEALECYMIAQALDPGEPMWPRHAAICAHFAGKPARALRILVEHAERFPQNAPLQHSLGEALLAVDDLDGAKAAFRRTSKLVPGSSLGWAGLGECRLRRDDFEGAAAFLERSVQFEPGYRSPHYLLGLAYRGLGRQDEALEQLQLGVNSLKRHMHDAWLGRAREYAVGLLVDIEAAHALVREGRAGEAVEKLRRMADERGDDFAVRISLAKVLIGLGRYQDAEAVLAEADQMDAGRLQVHFAKAECYHGMKRYGDALKSIDVVLEMSPKHAQAHRTRGHILYLQGRFAEAVESLTRSAEMEPSNADLHQLLGESLLRLNDWERAREHFVEFARLVPDAWQAHVKVGLTCGRLSRWDEARAALGRARALAPDESEVRRLEGLIAEHAQ